MARNLPFRLILTVAALGSALALEGCGRKGYPDAPSNIVVDSNGKTTTQNKLPHGVTDPALKPGARHEPTPFDFLL